MQGTINGSSHLRKTEAKPVYSLFLEIVMVFAALKTNFGKL